MVYHPQDREGGALRARRAPAAADTDTIAAIATPPGRGGIGIVRASGPHVPAIAERVLGGLPPARYATYGPFRAANASALDNGIALYFPAPHSFTGEDVLELHGHGGPVVLDLVLRRVLEAGARPARPGEFSERAFLNGKLDLAQAEAVADLIAAGTEQGARSAMRSLQGAFSTHIDSLGRQLVELRMFVESAIDFPEEEIDFFADGEVTARLEQLLLSVAQVRGAADQGRLLGEGITVVIAGQPNVGKSSLLNRLAGRQAAIVTAQAGTTRDILREQIHIDGMPLHIIDTAGLRDVADEVEEEGIRRAWAEITLADRLLLIIDDRAGFGPAEAGILERLPTGPACTVVRNKIDLSGTAAGPRAGPHGPEIALSALTGDGIEELVSNLREAAGYTAGGGEFMARRRHLDALDRVRAALEQGRQALLGTGAAELLAEELRQAQLALGEITGEFTSEDLLERIFSNFCIGK